ncbi:MAG: helix-turn-helix domain-containing protein [Propionivibrio sp.]|nr:helix-turn-helix domain-containing protein [Propionivibrio sp.]
MRKPLFPKIAEWGSDLGERVESLRDVSIKQIPDYKYLIPGLLPEDSNLVVGIGPNVDASMWTTLLLYSAGSGRSLSPFPEHSPLSTLVVSRASTLRRMFQQIKLVHEKDSSEEYRDLAEENLFFLRGAEYVRRPGYLYSPTALGAIIEQMPPSCRLVVFLDGEFALTPPSKADKTADQRGFQIFIESLNREGIATIIFHRVGRSGAEPLIDLILPDGLNYYINLTASPNAPTEYGTGFNVFQQKTSTFDVGPSSFYFWHLIVDQELRFGWEIFDQSADSAKKLEIFERRKKVQQLLEAGIQQREIAKVLEVDPATVCRDVSRLKPKKPPANSTDGEWENLSD